MGRPSLCARLLLLATLLPCCAIADTPRHLWARNDYPIPPETGSRLFFLQRSANPSTIVYEARMLPGRGLDPDRPIEVYWLRSRAAVRQPLDAVETNFAFGAVVRPDPSRAGAWIVRAAGYAGRSARLEMDGQGTPVLIGEVAGRRARLVSGYLELDGKGYMPRISAIDLYGIDTSNGAWLHERFTP